MFESGAQWIWLASTDYYCLERPGYYTCIFLTDSFVQLLRAASIIYLKSLWVSTRAESSTYGNTARPRDTEPFALLGRYSRLASSDHYCLETTGYYICVFFSLILLCSL